MPAFVDRVSPRWKADGDAVTLVTGARVPGLLLREDGHLFRSTAFELRVSAPALAGWNWFD